MEPLTMPTALLPADIAALRTAHVAASSLHVRNLTSYAMRPDLAGAIAACVDALPALLDHADSLSSSLAEQIRIASDLRNEVEALKARPISPPLKAANNALIAEVKSSHDRESGHRRRANDAEREIARLRAVVEERDRRIADLTRERDEARAERDAYVEDYTERRGQKGATLEARAVGVPDAEALAKAIADLVREEARTRWLHSARTTCLAEEAGDIATTPTDLAVYLRRAISSLPASPPVVGVDPGGLRVLAGDMDSDAGKTGSQLVQSYCRTYAARVRALIASAPPPCRGGRRGERREDRRAVRRAHARCRGDGL
jgi:hypothetical protein